MSRNTSVFCFLVMILAALAGCSSQQSATASKPAPAPDKIQGKAQVLVDEPNASDAALNAGGPTVYLWDGLVRYRLFFNKAIPLEHGKQYTAEGVYAQKAIDAIGDPSHGKTGYPLQTSCDQIVRNTWPGLPFDLTDADTTSLCATIKRHPARPIFLVTAIQPAATDAAKQKKDAEDAAGPEITVPADKQRALLVAGPTVLTAPLWQPEGGTATCKVVIGQDGKIAELNSGAQLCETVPWTQFSYKPTLKAGHPVRVDTEVEVRFDPPK